MSTIHYEDLGGEIIEDLAGQARVYAIKNKPWT